MGVVQNSIDIQKIIDAGGDPTIAAKVAELEAEIGDAKARADQAVLWSERKGYVGKNLLKNTATTSTYFTVNPDGTLNLSGTTTSAQTKDLNTFTGAELKAKGDKLILSGGDTKAYVALRTSSWTFIARTYGDDVLFDTSKLDDATTYYCTVGIQANTNVDGVEIKPMIRLASIADSTYEPYLPNNNELLQTATLKSVTAAATDFAAFKTAIAAL